MVKLSIIIVSHNTSYLTKKCLESLYENLKNYNFKYKIIVVDNASTDDTIDNLKKLKEKDKLNLLIIRNKKNLGYGKANNQGLKKTLSQYTLFLNSDTLIKEVNFEYLFKYLDENPKIGALTIKVIRPNGEIDWASHRGFPTLWRSFCYFTGLENLFSKIPYLNKLFGGYHLRHFNLRDIHEIDSPSGAFFLTRTKLIKDLNGFDESFFMYGEDLDLSWRIKEVGYKIIYNPLFTVVHHKYQSGLKGKDVERRKEIKNHFYQAMKIFYQKHYQKKYPPLINSLVYKIIDYKIKSL